MNDDMLAQMVFLYVKNFYIKYIKEFKNFLIFSRKKSKM